jgi:hypothetical protein
MMSCCDECHFEEEERHALGYLKPLERRKLLRAHRFLLSMPDGPKRKAVIQAHARWEDDLFLRRLPLSLATYFILSHHMMLPYDAKRDARLAALL